MSAETNSIKTVCVYCGSADGLSDAYVSAAFLMGQELANAGLRLIYGAGKTGLMGAVAEGVLQSGGEVTGVVPTYLNTPPLVHAGLTQLEVVDTIHLRKARMMELADAIIALPGGYGTFEELFEALTWAQIGLHHKPIGLLNTQHYFDPLIALCQHALKEGFIYDEHHAMLLQADTPRELLRQIRQFETPEGLDRWLTRE